MPPLCVTFRQTWLFHTLRTAVQVKVMARNQNWFLWVWVAQPNGLFIPYSGLRGKTTDATHSHACTHKTHDTATHACTHTHTQPPIPYLYYYIIFIITWREWITQLHLAIEMRDSQRRRGYQALLFFPGVEKPVQPTGFDGRQWDTQGNGGPVC